MLDWDLQLTPGPRDLIARGGLTPGPRDLLASDGQGPLQLTPGPMDLLASASQGPTFCLLLGPSASAGQGPPAYNF